MATFGPISDPTPNVLFDPGKALLTAGAIQRNQLLTENARQDQATQMQERDANARIALARQFADAPDDALAAEWGPAVQRMQQAGLGHGIDPSKPPPRERLKQIASSDLTTFQRLQLAEREKDRQSWAGVVMPGGAPGAPAAAPAGGQVADVPAEMMPHFQAASAATGVPVPLLVAQAKQESGFRPDATGRSGEIGVMQIMPSTAQQPGFGLQPIDPASLRDPGKNIMFGAQYLAARSPGANWNDPAQRGAALGRYNGGGDPNYAQNVTRNLPGAAAPQQPPPGAAPAPQQMPALDANGLTAQQAQVVMQAGPERGRPMMLQFAQQNRMDQDRQIDNTRAAEAQRLAAANQQRQAAVQAEQLQLQKDAAARAAEKDKREAARLPPKVIELVAETEDKLAGLQGARDALAEARKLSPQAYAGPAAELRGRAAATTGFDTASGTATTQFGAVMTEQALGQLRTIFGGNPTEGERKVLLDMMASTNMSRAEREALLDRAQRAVDAREEMARKRLTELRRGDYGEANPNAPAVQGQSKPDASAAKADPLEGRTITNGTTGERMVRRNGKWEAMQ